MTTCWHLKVYFSVSKFEVEDPNILFDHSFTFDFGDEELQDSLEENYEYVDGKFVWKSEFKDEYITRLNEADTLKKLNSLNANITPCSDENGIKSCLKDFVDIFQTVSSPIYKKSKQRSRSNAPADGALPNKNKQPWYSDECHEKKYCFLHMLGK